MVSNTQEKLQVQLCLVAELVRLRYTVRIARDESMRHDCNYSTIERPSPCTSSLTNLVDSLSDQIGRECFHVSASVSALTPAAAAEAIAGVPLAIAYLAQYLPDCPALLPDCVIRAVARMREVSK